MASNLAEEIKKISSKSASKLVQDVVRERDKTLSRPSGTTSKKDDPIDSLIRITSAGIGFVSEALHYRREKKNLRGEECVGRSQRSDNASTLEQSNEAIWTLDDTEREAVPHKTDSKSPKEPSDLAKAFLRRHPCHFDIDLDTRLALPVILVQRRPKKRARGFIRGYAPALADMGIDQETFLDFIDTFNKALEPNPWLYAINLAGLGGMAVPDPLMMLLGIGVGIATDAAMEAQSRFWSNKFLDCVNAELFIPRGLVCLVVTWKPDISDNASITAVDFDGRAIEPGSDTGLVQMMRDIIAQKTSSEEGLKRVRKQMQRVMKPSNSTFNWAEPAPLIFPSLDESSSALSKDCDGKKENATNRAERWIDNYMDKRAQAKWIEKNPDLPIIDMVPKPEFRSRYADPNHPASSGDIVAFLTGGHWQYGHMKFTDNGSSGSKTGPERHRIYEKLKPAEAKGKSLTTKSDSSKTQTGGLTSLLQKVRDILQL